MNWLSDEQLNSLNKDALIILFSSMQAQLASSQDQLAFMKKQLDDANAMIAENNHQIELLVEQIRIMNQRQFGRKSESRLSGDDGQITLFDFFNEAELLVKEDLKEPEIEEVVISSYRRSKRINKREEDLDGLPARIIEHKLSDEELTALFPEGYKELPEEIVEAIKDIKDSKED